MRVAIVAMSDTPANIALCRAGGWQLLSPTAALTELRPGDVAIGRLDVLPTLDGIEEGLWALNELEARGVTVVNGPNVALATHDKLLTARLLDQAGLPHPRTRLLRTGEAPRCVQAGSVVVKPRFGSWGSDVTRCDSPQQLAAHLRRLERCSWFRRSGALLQELVPLRGYDLRLVVAGEAVVGAVLRVCADGEWRTNIALGATRVPVAPPPRAASLALAAARALGAELVGVDLLPVDDRDWTILELNGAVDFTREYSLHGSDVFEAAVHAVTRRLVATPSRAVRSVVSLGESPPS
jgi:[lysine-biosynthesis-protein LysW]--L-2-aminoadipate ligase